MLLRCNHKYIGLLLLISLSISSYANVQTAFSETSQSRLRSGFLDLSQLNLSDEQKQKVKDMRSQNASQAHQVRQDIKTKRMELRDLMFDPTSNEAQIRMAGKQLNELQGKLEDITVNDFLNIRSVLTAEQKQKLSELKPGANTLKQTSNQTSTNKPTRPAPLN